GANVDHNAATVRQQTPASNVNYGMPPVSSGYMPDVPLQGPQTPSPLQSGFYQAPPPPQVPPKKSFWTARKLLVLIATCLLVLLIAGGGLFVYAYQLGKSNNQGVTNPAATATISAGQTTQTPGAVSTQTTPDTSLTA